MSAMTPLNATSYAADIQRERGLPVSFSCNATAVASSSSTASTSTSTSTSQTLTLLFGYEFAVIDPREPIGGEVIYQDLPSLEYFLLHYVAEAIGLLECNVATQHAIFQQQNIEAERSTSNNNNAEIPTVVSLSNVQPDEWETEIVCSELVDLPPDLICLPLRGIMQATFVGIPEDTTRVEQMLSKTIETVLNGNEIISPGIVDTIYIGSRVIPNPPTDGSEWRVSPAIWGSSVSLVVAALGIMGVFLVARRRRQRKNQRSEVIPDLPIKSKVVMTMDPENIELSDSDKAPLRDLEQQQQQKYPDQEVPSVDPLLISIATTRTASETIVDTDDSFQDGSTTATARSTPTPTNPQLLDNSNSPPLVINLQPRPKDSNGAALIRPPPTNNSSKPPLPTKPPTPPAASSPRSSAASAAAAAALSKPLKQRRKKKRKKKPKMVRVSSRERANEMETIAEIPEEGDTGDNDSEYSWYSETDSNASSRDVSPSRGSPVPSTSSSEEQIMVQLRQSLESPSQQLLLSCGSSSKDDDDEDDDNDDDNDDYEGETEIVKLVVASSSSSSKASAGEESTSSSKASSASSSSANSKPDESRGSSPVPSYWT